MAHLKKFRDGWRNQIFGSSLLYRFSFISEPVQVSDDIGIDYFCTIFIPKNVDRDYELIPKNSFSIQVKSKEKTKNQKVKLTKYLHYLGDLELPFLIGVVDYQNLKMSIFSGEFLTPFFAFKGRPIELEAQLCERETIPEDYNGWCSEKSPNSNKFVIPFPKIAEISGNMSDSEINDQANIISEHCKVIFSNIASFKMK